eukprot:2910014-Prymnesium_polylepis.2
MSLHSDYAARSASPAGEHAHTAHTNTTHAQHIAGWPGDTCRLALMGHRPFLPAGSTGPSRSFTAKSHCNTKHARAALLDNEPARA